MMRPKKSFKITCFYCHQTFKYLTDFTYKYLTDFTYMVKRAYCYRDSCEKQHRYNRWRDEKVKLEEYKEYLQEIKNQFGYTGGQNIILLKIRDDQLFKGEISLGKIKEVGEVFVSVQKDPLGSVCLYRKEFIEN